MADASGVAHPKRRQAGALHRVVLSGVFPEMLEEFTERYSARQRYLVGISGGRDSVALLSLLTDAGYGNLVLCHLNHGLRGRASGQDAAFVRRLGKEYGLSVEVGKVNVQAMARREKDSLENTARRARLEFFAETAGKYRCPRVLLAHHADDQVETVLMKLFRGAGIEGLEGMRESGVQRVGRRKLELIRPLLGWWREDIDAYVEAEGLDYREDLSNQERRFLRNRVRQELIPRLAGIFGRDVRGAVWRLGEVAAGENAFFRGLLEKSPVNEPEISLQRLRVQHPAVQRRWIRKWLRAQGVRNVGFREIESVRGLLDTARGAAKVNLPGDRFARRRAGKLFLE